MFTLSAFADEISPEPQEQVDVLTRCGVRHIELRSIHKTNVLALTDAQVNDLKALLDRHGFKLSAIGSPIGKVKIDQPFEPHLQRFERAITLCRVFDTPNIRIFSYYRPEGGGDWGPWRAEVLARMGEKVRRAEKAGVRLLHENEHNIYGDDPDRVVDLLRTLDSPHLRAAYDAANYVFCGYDPWAGLLQVGVALLQQLSGPRDGGASGQAAAPTAKSLVVHDERTGERYVKLPVPPPEVLDQALRAAGALLEGLRR